MKKIFLTLALMVSMFSMAPVAMAQTQMITCQSTFPTATLTDAIYWAHQPTAVAALRPLISAPAISTSTGAQPAGLNLAVQLATQGYTIDLPIMVWGWDPVCTMGYRGSYGYTWVPSLLQAPVSIAPGVAQPGTMPYDPGKPPAGSILVSLNAVDYPPFVVVAPPAPAPQTNVVGTCYPAVGVCNVGPALPAGITDGTIVTANGQNYVFHAVQTPFGTSKYFTPVASPTSRK